MPRLQTQRWHRSRGSNNSHDEASTATYLGPDHGAGSVKTTSITPFGPDVSSKSRTRRPLASLPLTLRFLQIRNEKTTAIQGMSLSPFFHNRHLSNCSGSSKGDV